MEKIRQTVTLTKETSQKIHDVSEKLGMSQTAVINLAILSGLDAIALSLNPEWASALEKLGKIYEKKTE